MNLASLSCQCGTVCMAVDGPHIAAVECLCASCRSAGETLSCLPGATKSLDDKGATPYVMHRKDRVVITHGHDELKAYRLSEDAGTRRVIATCCNTPMFMELRGGHWLSIYAALWPDASRPAVEMRTMTGARHDLPDDVPNLRTHSLGFYVRLFGAWAKMGFRNPKIADNGDFHV